jgi:thiol-disulfide isomerase/thioredoxin
MRKVVEMSSNIAVILAVLVLGGLMVRDRIRSSPGPQLNVGDTIRPLAGQKWNEYGPTLLLALRPGCPYCEKSMPFYRELAHREKDGRLTARLLAVVSSDEAKAREYAASNRLAMTFHSNTDFSKIKIQGTPTLALIDRGGRVERVWVGKLTTEEEADLLRNIAR